MNREIKFRAWNVAKKEMVYFGVFAFEQANVHQLAPNETKTIVYPMIGIESGEIITDSPLDAFNLMQYTGLKDKNGKEIYEGDILQDNNYPEDGISNEEVVWDKKFAMFNTLNSESTDFDVLEVVGNIYENPELLKNS